MLLIEATPTAAAEILSKDKHLLTDIECSLVTGMELVAGFLYISRTTFNWINNARSADAGTSGRAAPGLASRHPGYHRREGPMSGVTVGGRQAG